MTCKNQEDQRKFHEVLVSVFVPNEYNTNKVGGDVNFLKTTKSKMCKTHGDLRSIETFGKV
jgi:hypothetical protein